MSIQLGKEIVTLINDPKSLKVIASAGRDGVPSVTASDLISVGEDGKIQYLELVETSQMNKNLVYSIWFKRRVAISVFQQKGRSFQIRGLPVQAIISGDLFEKNYIEVRRRLGAKADLSTVWVIEPEEAREETLAVKITEEQTNYPLVGHLDRFIPAGH